MGYGEVNRVNLGSWYVWWRLFFSALMSLMIKTLLMQGLRRLSFKVSATLCYVLFSF